MSVLPPVSWSMNWKPPKLPTPCTAGGWITATRPPLGWNMRRLQFGRKVGHDIRGGVTLCRGVDPAGLVLINIMPALEALPVKLKPMTENAPTTSLFGIDDGLRAFGERSGVGQRRARGRLHDADQEALIFLRNEAGGDFLVDPDGGAKARKENQEQDITQLQGDVNDLRIGSGQPGNEASAP